MDIESCYKMLKSLRRQYIVQNIVLALILAAVGVFIYGIWTHSPSINTNEHSTGNSVIQSTNSHIDTPTVEIESASDYVLVYDKTARKSYKIIK